MVFQSLTHFTAESTEAMEIECLAQGRHKVMQSRFETLIAVSRNQHLAHILPTYVCYLWLSGNSPLSVVLWPWMCIGAGRLSQCVCSLCPSGTKLNSSHTVYFGCLHGYMRTRRESFITRRYGYVIHTVMVLSSLHCIVSH